MKNLIIVGAGGLGRQTQWLIERINEVTPTWNILGYVDDNQEAKVDDYPILGGIEYLEKYEGELAVAVAIATPKVRKNIVERIKTNTNIEFPNLIDPSVMMNHKAHFGVGNIIFASTILVIDVFIKDFVIINLDCTIGHDVELGSYITIYPSVNVSGNVSVGNEVEIGTGTQIIQGKKVHEQSIIGAGSVVVRDIPAKCTAVGSPAKPIKYFE